jgi:hypothetical protein
LDLSRLSWARSASSTSVITPKLDTRDNFKIGQPSGSGQLFVAQFGLRGQVFLLTSSVDTDVTSAEDIATQGCEQSADSAAPTFLLAGISKEDGCIGQDDFLIPLRAIGNDAIQLHPIAKGRRD